MINKKPIITTNQKSPPLKKIHAGVKKLRLCPKRTQFPENHATKIAPLRRINPNNNSIHLFMNFIVSFYLKRFLLWDI